MSENNEILVIGVGTFSLIGEIFACGPNDTWFKTKTLHAFILLALSGTRRVIPATFLRGWSSAPSSAAVHSWAQGEWRIKNIPHFSFLYVQAPLCRKETRKMQKTHVTPDQNALVNKSIVHRWKSWLIALWFIVSQVFPWCREQLLNDKYLNLADKKKAKITNLVPDPS